MTGQQGNARAAASRRHVPFVRVVRLLAPAWILLACLAAAPHTDPPARLSPAQRARLYHQWAEESLGDPSIEARVRGVRDIREAIALEPANSEHWLVLGRLRVQGEFDSESRDCFRRAIVLAPRDLRGHLELAAAWKREWMRTLDTLSVVRAMGLLDTAASLRPRATDPWLRLVPLRYQWGDVAGAARAAEHALAGRPRRPEAVLAAAYVAFRLGQIEYSDSLFRDCIPRLDSGLVPLFQNPAIMLGASAPPSDWSGLDPDPTTPENEIQLEYWSRVAHAFLLYYDPARPGMDARIQTYIQYGAPTRMEGNPNGVALFFRASLPSAPSGGRESQLGGNPDRPKMDFPTPIQAWQYPDLGMNVVLQDRSLHGHFEPQATRDFDPGSRPDPRVLAKREDLLALGGGLAVFHRLPPREQRIEAKAVVARFGGSGRPRLFAQVEAPGGPADSLRARWVVNDAAGRTLARGEGLLSVAACDPAERRAGQFTAELPAGAYQVSVSVRGAGGRRGLFQARTALEPDPPGLSLSDLVLTCGNPGLLLGGQSARFDANVEAKVAASAPLVGYLEIYRLAPGPDGLSRYEWTCNVRRAPGENLAGPRRARVDPAVLVSTSREESHLGVLRRQFVIVSVQSLPPGRYVLEVRVRDQVAGTVAERSAEFVRE